jgi:hypothetical protein
MKWSATPPSHIVNTTLITSLLSLSLGVGCKVKPTFLVISIYNNPHISWISDSKIMPYFISHVLPSSIETSPPSDGVGNNSDEHITISFSLGVRRECSAVFMQSHWLSPFCDGVLDNHPAATLNLVILGLILLVHSFISGFSTFALSTNYP